MIKKYFLFVLCLFPFVFIQAQNFVDNGINYSIIDLVNFYVEVSDNQSVNGSVVIPSSVVDNSQSYTVTSIKNDAFLNAGITSVVIPNTVVTIGNYAFSNCASLLSVIMGNSVTTLGEGAFLKCALLSSVIIPDTVTTIEKDTFAECTNLISISIGNMVVSIGKGAFFKCENLSSVVIPDSVITISDEVFYECLALSSVSFGNSVTSIGNHAFYKCANLTSIALPNSLNTISNDTFSECSGLTNLTFGNSVSSIGSGAFYNCSNLSNITLPNSLISLGSNSFFACIKITDIVLGNAVATINDQAFAFCNALTSFTITTSTPPVINANVFNGLVLGTIALKVPGAYLTAYDSAAVWTDFASEVLKNNKNDLIEISTYPNPMFDSFHISLPNYMQLQNVELFDIHGQLISKSTSNKVDVSNLSKGFYFVTIQTNMGSMSKKLVKE